MKMAIKCRECRLDSREHVNQQGLLSLPQISLGNLRGN